VSAPLVVAVPSKGRLQADSNARLAAAGLEVVQSGANRSYRARIKGMAGVEVAFLSAPEIAREIGAGVVHLGITGRDQVEETVPGFETRTALLLPLGFGRCEVVVAVPEAWIDVVTMEDLDDVAGEFRARHGRRLTVATKYVNLTRRWFAGHGIADYRIVESLGATEGAPATGAADLIVDITTTGATLRDNGLKILADGVILKSEASLVASRTVTWTDRQRTTLSDLLGRLDAKAARRAAKLLAK
jgi:ATP phosphoribosyltransferase